MATCAEVTWEIPVAGDAIRRRVTIDRSASKIPSGVTITKGWLTIKASKADADPGLIQKVITTTNVDGTGHIENDGTGNVNPVVRFDFTAANTLTIGVEEVVGRRHFDVQVIASDGRPYTPEIGLVFCCAAEVTKATS